MNTINLRQKQSGAALVVGLILLLILTVFAVSGMSTATLELVLAGNTQFKENAFQAAESAIEAEFRRGQLADTSVDRQTDYQFEGVTNASTTTSYRSNTLAEGYSITDYSADHYVISALGRSGKNAQSVNEQGFFIVVPGSGAAN